MRFINLLINYILSIFLFIINIYLINFLYFIFIYFCIDYYIQFFFYLLNSSFIYLMLHLFTFIKFFMYLFKVEKICLKTFQTFSADINYAKTQNQYTIHIYCPNSLSSLNILSNNSSPESSEKSSLVANPHFNNFLPYANDEHFYRNVTPKIANRSGNDLNSGIPWSVIEIWLMT